MSNPVAISYNASNFTICTHNTTCLSCKWLKSDTQFINYSIAFCLKCQWWSQTERRATRDYKVYRQYTLFRILAGFGYIYLFRYAVYELKRAQSGAWRRMSSLVHWFIKATVSIFLWNPELFTYLAESQIYFFHIVCLK